MTVCCSTSPSTSSPWGCRSFATSRAGSTRPSSPSAGSCPLSKRLHSGRRSGSSSSSCPDRRLAEPVEAAAYYVVAEALANVQKHAGASRVTVRATADDHALTVEVVDDGVGGADEGGEGLRGLADRVEALGGRLTLDEPGGRGNAAPGPDPDLVTVDGLPP